MTTVKKILEEKGHDYYSIGPDAAAFDALKAMAEKNVGSLMVIDKEGKLIGMFSERDYARKGILLGKSSKESRVEDYMSTDLYTVSPEATTLDCMALMTGKFIRHIPVLDHNKIVGIVSIGDIVNTIIHEQKITIQDLERYITSSGYGHQKKES